MQSTVKPTSQQLIHLHFGHLDGKFGLNVIQDALNMDQIVRDGLIPLQAT